MATPDDEDPWKPAVSLNSDGQLEGSHPILEPRRPAIPAPEQSAVAELELDLPAPQPLSGEGSGTSAPAEIAPARPRKLPLLAVAIVVALLCAAGMFVLLRKPGPSDAASIAPAQSANQDGAPEIDGALSLTILSEPPGATVFVDNEELGRTPLLASNGFAKGARISVRMELAGYRSWSGTLDGGVNAKLSAVLKPSAR